MSQIARPRFTIPPNPTMEDLTRLLNLSFAQIADDINKVDTRREQDPRMTDTRVAHALRVQQGIVRFDKVTRPNQDDILYAIDDGLNAVWGAFGVPSPTDPGTGPTGGVTDGDKGDITVSVGGTVWEIDAGAVGTNEIADGAVTAIKIANRSRGFYVPASQWSNLSGTVAIAFARGADAAGDRVPVMSFTPAGDSVIGATARIPSDYDSGTLEFFAYWASTAGTADTQGFFVDFSARGMVPASDAIGATPTSLAADQVLPTTMGPDVNFYRTSLGALSTDVAAGRLLKMQFKRDVTAEIAASGLATTQDLGLVGIEAIYTADS